MSVDAHAQARPFPNRTIPTNDPAPRSPSQQYRPGGFDDQPAMQWPLQPSVNTTPTPVPKNTFAPVVVQQMPDLHGVLLHLQANTINIQQGDFVSEWRDPRKEGLMAFSFSPDRRPRFIGGDSQAPARVAFDGVDDRMVISDLQPLLRDVKSMTVIMVAQSLVLDPQDLWGINREVEKGALIGLSLDANRRIVLLIGDGHGARNSEPYPTQAPAVYTLVTDRVQAEVYVDGERRIVTPMDSPLPFADMTFMTLGTRALNEETKAGAFHGSIYELYVIDHKLEPRDRAAAEQALQRAYSVR